MKNDFFLTAFFLISCSLSGMEEKEGNPKIPQPPLPFILKDKTRHLVIMGVTNSTILHREFLAYEDNAQVIRQKVYIPWKEENGQVDTIQLSLHDELANDCNGVTIDLLLFRRKANDSRENKWLVHIMHKETPFDFRTFDFTKSFSVNEQMGVEVTLSGKSLSLEKIGVKAYCD